MMGDAILIIDSLVKHFPVGKGKYVGAVRGVSFAIRSSSTLALVGESGSGKTTVGRCALGLMPATAGRVVFEGRDLQSLKRREVRQLRSRMQLVFQDPLSSFNPRYSVARIVEEPLIVGSSLGKSERLMRVRAVLEDVRLPPEALNAFPTELTASAQQRVALARALVTDPGLVVLDEPTSNLDTTVRAEILALLRRLQSEKGTAYLLISHDLTAVEEISDMIAIMYLGRIVEIGPTADIYDVPRHPYSHGLLSSVLYSDPLRPLEPLRLQGEIPSAINPPEECPLCGRCPIEKPVCQEGFPATEAVAETHSVACRRWRDYEKEVTMTRSGATAAR